MFAKDLFDLHIIATSETSIYLLYCNVNNDESGPSLQDNRLSCEPHHAKMCL